MKEYDVIVIGSGSGLTLAAKALKANLSVALVAKRFLGGTCLNAGCIPSKTLIYPADLVEQIGKTDGLGVKANIVTVDFKEITERMRGVIDRGVAFNREWVTNTPNLDFYEAQGYFIDSHAMEIRNGPQITAGTIFIASGAQPAIPRIKGLDEDAYMTNETVLRLKARPPSLLIIGAGRTGVEYAHFFAAMGTRVTLVELKDRPVSNEEPEISKLLEEELNKRMSVYTSTEIVEVAKRGGQCVVHVKTGAGTEKDLAAENILVAAGRKSSAASLNLKATGVETDERGFIKVDDYLETTQSNIWAVGDATGKQMFTHAADAEVETAWHNARSGGQNEKVKFPFSMIPHAVYTHPQIASIGMNEAEARKHFDVLVGRANYSDTVQGGIRTDKGFAKAIVEKKSGRILGFHIIGPGAPELIQEVVTAMANGLTSQHVAASMHIFPSMSELIPAALNNLQ
jgi:dihydrolipoamide dehydrogenase